MIRRPPRSPLFPYPTLFRSGLDLKVQSLLATSDGEWHAIIPLRGVRDPARLRSLAERLPAEARASSRSASRSEEHTSELQSQSNLVCRLLLEKKKKIKRIHKKSTRLNSSHSQISYAVFCLKKKKDYHMNMSSQYLQRVVDNIDVTLTCTPDAPAPVS